MVKKVWIITASCMLIGLLLAGPGSAACRSTPPVGPADGQARLCVLESYVYEDPGYTYRSDTLVNTHAGWYDPQNLYVIADSDVSWYDIASCWDTFCTTYRATYAFHQVIACTQVGCIQGHAGASQLASEGPGSTYQGTFVGGGAQVGRTAFVETAYFQSGFNGACNEYLELDANGRIEVLPSQPCTYVIPFVDLPPL